MMELGRGFGERLEKFQKVVAQKKRTKQHEERQADWEQFYAPTVEEYAAGGLEASGNVLEREMAKLRMRLGYNQSMGAGTAGWWNLARGGMLTEGMKKYQDIASDWERWQTGQYLGYMSREDQQAHQLKMQQIAYQQQLELMRQQAELNDPTWWQTLGSIVGIGLGIWAIAGFPWFTATAAAGGIVGGGVGGTTGMIF